MLFPLIGAMEKLVVFLFPDNGQQAEDQDMDRLEERFLRHPALSIEQSRLVTNSMAERAAGNLLDAMACAPTTPTRAFRLWRRRSPLSTVMRTSWVPTS